MYKPKCEFTFAFKAAAMVRQGEIPASQRRAKETRDRVAAALGALLREKPFSEIGMAEIAARAGVSVGAVYRRFENKDALIPVILELYRDSVERFAASPEGRYRPDPDAGLRAALKGVAEAAWRYVKREGALLREAQLYARLRPELAGEDWDALMAQSVASYEGLLDLFSEEVARKDRRAAAGMVFYLLNSLIAEYGVHGSDGPGAALTLPDEGFVAAVADAVYGYLSLPEADRA